jgi:poly [ADP-ribose] polymerase
MAKVKAWKFTDPAQPVFPDEFEITQKRVLQATDLKNNHNKYYAIELHTGGSLYRVFTQYGRTDDLERNPESGQRECRYFDSLLEAERNFQSILAQKTSARKGYQEVALASVKIGSAKARGSSAGEVDVKTLEKLQAAQQGKDGQDESPAEPEPPKLSPDVADLVGYLYEEATKELTSKVQATITAQGIETPLGILTVGQIEKGEAILQRIYKAVQSLGEEPSPGSETADDELQVLSGQFYSVIPHRIGRTRQAIASATINTMQAVAQKQETLQLMSDMLEVSGDEQTNVLYDAKINDQYDSLKCHIEPLPTDGDAFKQLAQWVVDSQIRKHRMSVKRIFRLAREGEAEKFTDHIEPQRLLMHGSRVHNWVGLLSRGILMPKLVVSMGVKRTDAGWLGHGIYFGDAACTSIQYTSAGKRKTRYMTLARVALGNAKQYHKITHGLTAPPPGYDSTHGVRNKPGAHSEFADDEYVIYNADQQKMEYLVEFSIAS